MRSHAPDNGWTGGQYSLFRALLGIYALVHLTGLLAWAPEVFSSAGMLADKNASPLLHLFPNIFILCDAPWFVRTVIASAAAASLLLIVGYRDKAAALWIWFTLACLFGRNPLIANPSMPYFGFMLLAHLFTPHAPFGSLGARGRADVDGGWAMPRDVFMAAWIVLALAYSYSGYTKLMSPSWVSGDSIDYVLNNPLARDNIFRHFLLWLPPLCLKLVAWTVLYVELLFAPLALVPRLRPALWGIMLFVQLGFALLLNFFDLTAAMLLFHLMTFDPAWIRGKVLQGRSILFYDGNCGLCHRVILFLLAEDCYGQARFAPMDGKMFIGAVRQEQRQRPPDSLVLMTADGMLHTQSCAVGVLLMALGGLWRPLGQALLAVPKPLRDAAFSSIGRIGRRVLADPAAARPCVTPALKERFLA